MLQYACAIHNYKATVVLCVYIILFTLSSLTVVLIQLQHLRFYPSDDSVMWKIVNHCLADP